LAAGLVAIGLMAGGAVAAPMRDPAQHFKPAEAPQPTPDYSFTDADGRRTSLSDFKGKTVLLNFWATWCPPCIKEMPALDALQAELGGAAFVVVTVSLDRAGHADVAPFFTKTGIKNLPAYLDPKWQAMKTFNLKGLPTTLLIDKEGREIGRLEGEADWSAEGARSLIRKHLDAAAG